MNKSHDGKHGLNEYDQALESFALPPIDFPSTGEIVQRHLERIILAGVMKPGEKLPPERILAEQLGVSRNVLRRALKVLSAKNLIRSTHGGGNYVNEVIGSQMTDPIANLLRENSQALDDFIEFRSEFEGSTAYLAAERATPHDIKTLELIFDRMEAAHLAQDLRIEAVLDADFHMAIAELSHNIVFIHISHSLRVLMQQELLNTRLVLFDEENGTRGAVDRQLVLEQHRAILSGICERNSEKAAAAMRDHLRFVRDKLREFGTIATRKDVSSQRLSRWIARVSTMAK